MKESKGQTVQDHLLRCSPVYRATATAASLVDDTYITAPSTATGKKVGIVVEGNATAGKEIDATASSIVAVAGS